MCETSRMRRNLTLTPLQAPCKECSGRQVSCHTSCNKYITYRREVDARNEKQIKDASARRPSAGFCGKKRDYEECKRRGRLHY